MPYSGSMSLDRADFSAPTRQHELHHARSGVYLPWNMYIQREIDDLSDVWTVCNRRQLSAPIACKGLHMRRRASYDRGTVQNHFWPTMAEGTSFWTEELANTWYLASIIASFWFFDHFFFVTDLGHRIDCSSLKGDLNLKRSFFLKSRFLEWDILLIV